MLFRFKFGQDFDPKQALSQQIVRYPHDKDPHSLKAQKRKILVDIRAVMNWEDSFTTDNELVQILNKYSHITGKSYSSEDLTLLRQGFFSTSATLLDAVYAYNRRKNIQDQSAPHSSIVANSTQGTGHVMNLGEQLDKLAESETTTMDLVQRGLQSCSLTKK